MSKIAAQILRLAELDLPLNEPVLAAKKYMEITAPQIQESFAKWLRPADFVQVTLGPNPK
jgi:zinc protease